MGFSLGDLVDPFDIFGGDDAADAAKEAANIQARSSEAGIAESRRQYDELVKRMQPFFDRGVNALPGVDQATSVGGLDSRLAEIFGSNTFGALQDQRMRAVQNQMNQSGMRRSDAGLNAVASVPTDLGLMIEQMLYGRQMDAVSSGQNAAAGIGSAGMQTGANISSMLAQQGNARAQGVIGAQQAQSAAMTNMINTGLTVGALMFSDPRLKTNITKIGQIKELGLYTWEWAENVPVWAQRMRLGFLTTEVRENYPHHVGTVHGFDAVNYQELINELEAA